MTAAADELYQHPIRTLQGIDTTLAHYRGQVLLIVNVASKCVFTGQFSALESLHRQYRDRGLVVLGFPCNQFGKGEPGAAADIQAFCTTQHDVSFPLFAKLDVNGEAAHPLYQQLKRQQPGLLGSTAIKWNFTKFLIGRDGQVLARFAPHTRPSSLNQRIEHALELHAKSSPAGC